MNTGYDIEEVQIGGENLYFVGTDFPVKLAIFSMENGIPRQMELMEPFDEIDQMIFAFAQDERFLWLGSYGGGLYRYNKETGFLKTFIPGVNCDLPSEIIRDLQIDQNGDVWIATGYGLSRIRNDEKHKDLPDFIVYQTDLNDISTISYNYILTLFESGDGSIWIGTMGGGLNKYLGGDNFLRIDISDGLTNNVIKGILEDESGNLWISSNKGLNKYNIN